MFERLGALFTNYSLNLDDSQMFKFDEDDRTSSVGRRHASSSMSTDENYATESFISDDDTDCADEDAYEVDADAYRNTTPSIVYTSTSVKKDTSSSSELGHSLGIVVDMDETYGTPRDIIVPIYDIDLVSPIDQPINQTSSSPSTQQLTTRGNLGKLVSSTVSPPLSAKKVNKSDFRLLRVVGKGAYGKVFLVQKVNGIDKDKYFAMKVLRKAHIVLHDKDTEHTKAERSILEEVRHPFIVRLFYAFQTDDKLYLILDYASGGELFMYLEKEKMLLEDVAVFYMAELVLAIEHLHKLGIIYRDLKPENILLDEAGHVKLTDFGLSKVSINDDDKTNTVCGTVEYMAPEALANIAYDKSVDWWSLGAVSFDILTGAPPFTASNRKKTMDLIMNKKLALPHYLSPDAKDLLTRLMRKRSNVRLGFGSDDATPIRKHRFFKSINWAKLLRRECTPPITPKITSPEDVANFHSTFTSMPVVDSPTAESSSFLKDKDVFSGFSYIADSVLNSSKFEDIYLSSSANKSRSNHFSREY